MSPDRAQQIAAAFTISGALALDQAREAILTACREERRAALTEAANTLWPLDQNDTPYSEDDQSVLRCRADIIALRDQQ